MKKLSIGIYPMAVLLMSALAASEASAVNFDILNSATDWMQKIRLERERRKCGDAAAGINQSQQFLQKITEFREQTLRLPQYNPDRDKEVRERKVTIALLQAYVRDQDALAKLANQRRNNCPSESGQINQHLNASYAAVLDIARHWRIDPLSLHASRN